MTDLSSMIRDAFQDDPVSAVDRDRLWNTMAHHRSRQARMKLLVRAGFLLLAAVVGALAMWNVMRSQATRISTIPVAADSIFNPVGSPMPQQTNQEVPSSVIPLLGHRSSLRIDIQNLENRQLELAHLVTNRDGAEREVATRQLAAVEKDLEATRAALQVVDAQIAGQPFPAPPAPPGITEVGPPQVFQFGGGGIPNEVLYTGAGLGTLLVLGMIAMMAYMRRVSRTMRDVLTAIENQVASQHATLASGIDAIAVEVERLGEGQRFMSKVLGGTEAKAPVSRT